MKTKRFDSQGFFKGFEIPNTLVGKEGVREILQRLPDLEIQYLDKSWPQELFCEFTYKGLKFEVSEPYGDNSHYDIICEKPDTQELEDIFDLFSSASVPTKMQWIRIAKVAAVLCAVFLVALIFIRN